MKRIFLIIFIIIFSASALQTILAENYEVPFIYIAKERFIFENNKPILRNGRVLVPLNSGFFTKIGADVQYEIINKESVIKTRKHLITNYIQELDWYNNGIRCYAADVRSDYLNGDAYVPLRAVVESLGEEVVYDNETFSVYIN